MSDNAKLKIALFAYCETFLDKYHAHLHTKADCWWVVWNPYLRRDLLNSGYKKIFFEDTCLLAFQHQIKNIIIRKLHGLLFYTFRLGRLRQNHLVKKVNATFQPDIWLSDSATKLIRTKVRGMTVALFHSVCYKKYQTYEETLSYDLILLPGEQHKKRFIERYGEQHAHKMKVVGWPRADHLLNGEISVDEKYKMKSDLGLNPQWRTVIYAPTWNAFEHGRLFPKSFGDDVEVFETLAKKCRSLELNLLVRLHSEMGKLRDKERLHALAAEYGVYWNDNLGESYTTDNSNWLFISDILIGDVSGVIMDFMILDRPIIYTEPDEDFPWDVADIPGEYRAGPVCVTLVDLMKALEDSHKNPDAFKALRRKVLDTIFYKLDGHSAKRASEAILSHYEDFKKGKASAS